MGEKKKHNLLKKIVLNKKTKQNLLLVGLGMVLVIITIVVVMTTANQNKITFSYNVGEIKNSAVVDTEKHELTVTTNVQGQKVSQTCAYERVSGDDTSTNGTYEAFDTNGDRLEIVITDDSLTIVYPDGDSVVFTKE